MMVLDVCVLRSGSSGNCTLITRQGWHPVLPGREPADHDETILIDCGINDKYLREALATLKLETKSIKALLITHGHGDHIGDLRIPYRYDIPVFMHKEIHAVRNCECRKIKDKGLLSYYSTRPLLIGKYKIKPFAVYHGQGKVGKAFGFRVEYDHECAIGYVTDTGSYDANMVKNLTGCRLLIAEANYNQEMIDSSDAYRKHWVASSHGHLANHQSANLIAEVYKRDPRLSHVFLAHLSHDHNTLAAALGDVKNILQENGITGINLLPTYRDRISQTVTVS